MNGPLLILTGFLLSAPFTRAADLQWKSFRGMCDASAVEMLDKDLFVAGNDEDNVLRIYSRSREGLPLQALDFSTFYRLPKKAQEIDLEGSARIGDRLYWISSHGANAKGKYQASRHRFFAVEISTNNRASFLRPIGQLYAGLVRDLVAEPAFARFRLGAAAQKAPKEKDALNIEALAATPENHLLIGFRNPIPDGKALVVTLINPEEVISGKKARFGGPTLLDLGGLGVRSMISTTNGYLIVAGSYDGGGGSRLYQWTGSNASPSLLSKKPLPGNPEGIALVTDATGKTNLLVLNDDGTRNVLGTDCKKVKNPHLKSFRGYEMAFEL